MPLQQFVCAFRHLRDCLRFAANSILAYRTRSLLTALSMVVANSSVILVMSVTLTGRDFVIAQIQGVGSNLVYAYYEPGSNVSPSEADYITRTDVEAVRRRLGSRAQSVAGVISTWYPLFIDGQERQVRILGASVHYQKVRNLQVLTGSFFTERDTDARVKVCLLTETLAQRLFGSSQASIGRIIPIYELQFRVIGVFREGVQTLGQTEVSSDSILIPITVIEYFRTRDRIDPLYVSVSAEDDVENVTALVAGTLSARHRPGSSYRVQNLKVILNTARTIAQALTTALIILAGLTLLISGIFIMNIMLISVGTRTREIGIRLSIGAKRSQIRMQFLLEAVCLSMAGGLIGVIVGVSLPLTARMLFPYLPIPIAPLSIVAALIVSCLVGIFFGLVPASRAAALDPIEALRYD